MTIPDFQSLMLPALAVAADGSEHSTRDVIDTLAQQFRLTDQERRVLLPSGRQAKFDNRVHWAISHLKHAGLLDRPKRSYLQITPRGMNVMQERPPRIDMRFLSRFPEFVEFTRGSVSHGSNGISPSQLPDALSGESAELTQTPEELLEQGYVRIRQALVQDIIERIMGCTATFFEQLVVELLVKMGYGGSRMDAGKAVGRSGDEGIDGIIKEDRLGLDVIYIQAKRWKDTVGRPAIHGFVGALQGQHAKKGIFITTSAFTREARQYAAGIESKVVLIDGIELAELMIDNNVGVSTQSTYEIKKVDSDFFTEG